MAIVVFALVVAAWLVFDAGAPALMVESAHRAIGTMADAAPREAADQPRAQATPSSSEVAWLPRDSTAVVAERYRSMKDKRRFYDLAVRVGGPAYTYFAWEAYFRCIRVNGDTMAGVEQVLLGGIGGQPDTEARIDALRAYLDGCQGFETRPLAPGEGFTQLKNAAKFPGAIGAVLRLAFDQEHDREVIRAALPAIVESGDTVALRWVDRYFVEMKVGQYPRGQSLDLLSAQQRYMDEQEAWALAKCRLGADCGRESSAWWNACVSGGKCGGDYVERLAESRVAPGHFPGVLTRAEEIVTAYRARNWAALGL